MARQTNVENLEDIIRNFGGTPTGRTKAELLDQIESLPISGGGDGGTAVSEGVLNDDDIARIFEE